jgi:hypothetical protein
LLIIHSLIDDPTELFHDWNVSYLQAWKVVVDEEFASSPVGGFGGCPGFGGAGLVDT